jgi:hypothetical protein
VYQSQPHSIDLESINHEAPTNFQKKEIEVVKDILTSVCLIGGKNKGKNVGRVMVYDNTEYLVMIAKLQDR